jgi:hypothetical protein
MRQRAIIDAKAVAFVGMDAPLSGRTAALRPYVTDRMLADRLVAVERRDSIEVSVGVAISVAVAVTVTITRWCDDGTPGDDTSQHRKPPDS